MNKERDPELERPEAWDLERPEVRGPVKAPRVVVSVAFHRGDFEQVSEHAERVGKRTSEFIREAAIEKATGGPAGIWSYGGSSLGTSWWSGQIPVVTKALGSQVEDPQKRSVTTY